MTSLLPELRLKKSEDRRLRQGHLWIFSNEVDTVRTPLEGYAAGDLIRVTDAKGQALGVAYVNPATLICARLLTRDAGQTIDAAFWRQRLDAANRWRERCFDRPFYRLAYGESDGLPGLIVDRFGDVLVVQSGTAGVERQLENVLAALRDLLQPRAIVLKNTAATRALEGLETCTRVVHGELAGSVEIEENDARFLADPLDGQKTGWFFDHRVNRRDLAPLCRNRRVLDLFCYTGGWGIQAALHGAREVAGVDASATALELARDNARLNGVEARCRWIEADAFEFLRQMREERERFDVIILDPPALIRRKKDMAAGLEAYRRLNQLALQILSWDGLLLSASCSHHLGRDDLRDILRASARHVDRHLPILAESGQGPDHPVHPAMPETAYLKSFLALNRPAL